MINSKDNFVKTIFDFGWKSNINSWLGELAFSYQRGNKK